MDGAPAEGTQAAPTSPPWGAISLAAGRGPKGTQSPEAGAPGPGEGRRERCLEADDTAPNAGSGASGPGRDAVSGGRRRGVGLRTECADSPSGRGLSLDGAGRGRSPGHARPSGRLRPPAPGAQRRPRCGGRLRPPAPLAPRRAPTCSGRTGRRGALLRPEHPAPAHAAPPGPSALHSATPASVGDGQGPGEGSCRHFPLQSSSLQ